MNPSQLRSLSSHEIWREQINTPLILLALGGSGGEVHNSDLVEKIREKHFRILVIDDEDGFRKSLCFLLRRKYSAQVDDVNSGSLAVAAIMRGETYDLVFSDIMMPGMTGTDVFEQLQRIDQNLRVVLMSAFSDSDEWERAEKLGAQLLHKPIDDDLLIKILSQSH